MLILTRSTVIACVVGLAVTSAHAQKQTVYKPGNGVTLPQVTKEVKPEYTAEAKKARIAGTVLLDVTVTEKGEVEDVQVIRSLDQEFGLDQQAIKAAKQWLFKPGTKDGNPVPVRVSLEMTFTLK
jgi:protein TonB